MKEIVIVGAGVIGLTNAIKLAQAGFSVQVYFDLAKEFITSWAAAAFWLPVLSGEDPRIPAIAAESLKEFNELAKNPATGVRPVRLWVCYGADEHRADLSWLRATPTRQLRQTELPAGCGFGFEALVFRMQMEDYLPYLIQRAQWLGVSFEQKHIADLSTLKADLVVNCTGVMARHVAGDHKVSPIRGQVVLVKTPEELRNPRHRNCDVLIIEGPKRLDYVVFRDNDTLLGGTAEESWNVSVNPKQTISIINNCGKIFPALAKAEIIGERVGLRPFRPLIRMDIEQKPGFPLILNNFGHGGSGVTLSWGNGTLVQGMAAQWFYDAQSGTNEKAA